jgi:hypothetical protein
MDLGTVPSHLTDLAIRAAKPSPTRYKLNDSFGLHLLVMPSGSKHWRFDYRFAGARRTLTIGPYTLFGLQQAREERDKARLLLREGADPAELRKLG